MSIWSQIVSRKSVRAPIKKLEKRSNHERRRCLPEIIQKRNQAVLDHLGLAHLAASREAAKGTEEKDDLIQEASLGLIKAMEKFDASLGFQVSSYGMARAKGQILHFRRDRCQIIRVPWRLRDLYVRGMRLQQKQLQKQLSQFTQKQLAEKLKVSEARWQKAIEYQWQTRIVSLDQINNSRGEDGDPANLPLLDQLKSPGQNEPDQQCIWLKNAIRSLNRDQQRWLYAHYINGLSIRQLARQEKIHQAVLQRGLKVALEQLQLWAKKSPEVIISQSSLTQQQRPWPLMLQNLSAIH